MGPTTPILIGVGDITNRDISFPAATEPLHLMLQSIQAALADTSLPAPARTKLQASIDSIDVVATWTWPYPDLAGLIGEGLGVGRKGCHRFVSDHGGNQPVKLLDEAARRVSKRKSKVAVVTGGEALASCKWPESDCL